MSRKIMGVTVGTPTSPKKIKDEIKPVQTVNGVEPDENGNVEISVSGGGGGGIDQETDPTVPDWAKQPQKPKYTASEVGARPDTWTPTETDPTVPAWAKQPNPPAESDPTVPAWAKEPNKPTYTAKDVGARPNTWTPTPADIGLKTEEWTLTYEDGTTETKVVYVG